MHVQNDEPRRSFTDLVDDLGKEGQESGSVDAVLDARLLPGAIARHDDSSNPIEKSRSRSCFE
jgi:hypothetical protein